MIVELAGLPMAGKSTLQVELVAALRAEGVPVIERSALQTRRWTVVRRWRCLGLGLLAMVCSSRPLGDRLIALRLLAGSLTAHEAMRRRHEVLVVSEGFVQRAFLLFVEAGARIRWSLVHRFARAMPKADLVVLVPTSADEILRRAAATTRSRGLPDRLAGLSTDELGRVLVEGAEVLDRVAAASGVEVISGDSCGLVVRRVVPLWQARC